MFCENTDNTNAETNEEINDDNICDCVCKKCNMKIYCLEKRIIEMEDIIISLNIGIDKMIQDEIRRVSEQLQKKIYVLERKICLLTKKED